MKNKPRKLSKASSKVLEAFDEAAKNWGYTSDQGTGKEVDNSEASYNECKAALTNRLLRLEAQNKMLSEKIKLLSEN